MVPQLILLVGLQGCGKTTYAKEYMKKNSTLDFILISQDVLGKKEHLFTFKDAVQNKRNIIVDRINHTQEQRDRYLFFAKKNGYSTTIINLNLEVKTCILRVLKRRDHPTFNPASYAEASKSFLRIIREYEPPVSAESDFFIDETGFDPYCLDLSNRFSNFIIIGDIHGCFDELKQLLSLKAVKEELESKNTAIVCIGDLVDKGPKSKEVLDWFFELKNNYGNCFSVRGNHEYKLQRYLRGNDIEISHGLEDTIKQCRLDLKIKDYDKKYAEFLLQELDSLPFMIKISNNSYVTHAGVHPFKHPLRQPKEFMLFARTYNPITHSFNTIGDAPWFKLYDEDKPTIYFGHQYFENFQVKKNVFSLDGYCVYGNELRGAIIKKNSHSEIYSQKLVSVKANKQYHINEGQSNFNFLKHYDDLTNKGYLKKSVKNNLVLYNYSQKTIYEKFWNTSTMQARGLVFDSTTQELIARPFGKFFNINENELSQLHNLPLKEPFEIFEKIDGVLGIIFYNNNSWQLTTRGDLNSFHAEIGQELLNKKIDTSKLNSNYTYLCEIVHPQCEVIISYKKTKDLILLGAIETKTGFEIDYDSLQKIAKKAGFSIVSRIDTYSSLEEVLKDKTNWNSTIEGYVIRFKSGLRVKIKSDAYLSLVELKNESNIYRLIDYIDKSGTIKLSVFKNVPEELEERLKKNISLIEAKYLTIKNQIESEIMFLIENIQADEKLLSEFNNDEGRQDSLMSEYIKKDENIRIRDIATIIFSDDDKDKKRLKDELKHLKVIIPYLKKQENVVLEYIKKNIKLEIQKEVDR